MTKKLYITIKERTYSGLANGRIPKLDIDKSINMLQDIDVALQKSLEQSDDSDYVICEIDYDIIDLIDMFFKKQFLPPTMWLIESGFSNVELDDRELQCLKKLYPGSTFEFYSIVINYSDIKNVYKVDKKNGKLVKF